MRGLRIQIAKHLRPVDPYPSTHPHIVGARPGKHEGDFAARVQRAGCIEDPLAAVHGGGRFGEQAALAHSDGTLEIGAPGGVERQSEAVVVRPRRLHDVPPPRQGFDAVCGAVLRVGDELPQRRQTGLKRLGVAPRHPEEGLVSAPKRLSAIRDVGGGRASHAFEDDVRTATVAGHHTDTGVPGAITAVAQPRLGPNGHIERPAAPRVRGRWFSES